LAYDLVKEDIAIVVKVIAQRLAAVGQHSVSWEESNKRVQEMVDEDKYRECQENIKIEDHIELVKVAYYLQNKSIFNQLI